MTELRPTIRHRLIDNPVARRILNLAPNIDPKINRFILQQWFEGEDGQGEWRTPRDSQQVSNNRQK